LHLKKLKAKELLVHFLRSIIASIQKEKEKGIPKWAKDCSWLHNWLDYGNPERHTLYLFMKTFLSSRAVKLKKFCIQFNLYYEAKMSHDFSHVLLEILQSSFPDSDFWALTTLSLSKTFKPASLSTMCYHCPSCDSGWVVHYGHISIYCQLHGFIVQVYKIFKVLKPISWIIFNM
jgi:hypothetical protein